MLYALASGPIALLTLIGIVWFINRVLDYAGSVRDDFDGAFTDSDSRVAALANEMIEMRGHAGIGGGGVGGARTQPLGTDDGRTHRGSGQ